MREYKANAICNTTEQAISMWKQMISREQKERV